VAAIAAYGEVAVEGAVLNVEAWHARTGRADIDRSTCTETTAASTRCVATFYSESLDVDAFERQGACSRNGLVVQIVK